MKSYNHIEYWNKGFFGESIIAFDKLDGTNVRAEWNPKRGWYKFGTRNNMIDEKNEQFGEAVTIFKNKYGESLGKVFIDKYKKVESFVVFAEYLGENSFAGNHLSTDIKDVILFDVDQYKHGLITPYNFVKNFGHLHIPDIIYKGTYTMDLVNDIRDNKYGLKEGVVVKGIIKSKSDADRVWMIKIKTNEWLYRVKSKYGDKALLLELNGDKSLLV